MEVTAVAQRHGQEHLQSLLVSGVVAEPHHAEPIIIGSPIKEGAIVTNYTVDKPEDTTVTGRVVVIVMEVET